MCRLLRAYVELTYKYYYTNPFVYNTFIWQQYYDTSSFIYNIFSWQSIKTYLLTNKSYDAFIERSYLPNSQRCAPIFQQTGDSYYTTVLRPLPLFPRRPAGRSIFYIDLPTFSIIAVSILLDLYNG